MATTHIFVACGLVASNAFAVDQPNEGPCSNRTLSGDYGFSLQGILFAIPGVTLPPGATVQLRGVVMTHFDGKGNFTNTVTLDDNGTVTHAEDFGPYTVNADCTGTLFILGGTGNIEIVLVDGRKEFYGVATNPSSIVVTSSVAKKQFPDDDDKKRR